VTFLEDAPVLQIVPYPDHVEVRTDEAVFEGGTLTVCAGSWTPTALAGMEFGIPLTLPQEQVTYFAAADLRPFAPDRFPIWIFHGLDKTFYGFPVYGEAAVKAARDMSGRFVTQQTRSYQPNPTSPTTACTRSTSPSGTAWSGSTWPPTPNPWRTRSGPSWTTGSEATGRSSPATAWPT
jgi:glycine/D-amino acid oxidase-like deaminating enzyme